MNLKNIIAVSGVSGLMELVSSKPNGLLLMDPITKKTQFYSIRMHQFTPLETVSIYTSMDTVDVTTVFKSMMDNEPTPLSSKVKNEELMSYLQSVLPDYDRDRVHPGDVKKLIKWYLFSKEMGYLTREEEKTDEVENIEEA